VPGSSWKAAAISSQCDSRPAAVRYSAPVIGGAASGAAQGVDEEDAQLASIREDCGQRRADLAGAEL